MPIKKKMRFVNKFIKCYEIFLQNTQQNYNLIQNLRIGKIDIFKKVRFPNFNTFAIPKITTGNIQFWYYFL